MHWKLKALAQKTIALLPSGTSYAAYYWIQRRFGSLRRVDPVSKLRAGIDAWTHLVKKGRDPSGKVFFEVGTGRVPLMPMAFWLMGSEQTITVDLNPYLKEELVGECLQYVVNNKNEISNLFGPLLNRTRFEDLIRFGRRSRFSLQDFLEQCHINYIAPGDAADTSLSDGTIDFHTSYTVFEHVPCNQLVRILEEGKRLMKEDGLFIHRIDYSDHFSHSDRNITAINFLQYSDTEWDWIAGNRYMYMNRLRHDDFIDVFHSAGLKILNTYPDSDSRILEMLKRRRFQLDDRFQNRSPEILSITASWILSRKFLGSTCG